MFSPDLFTRYENLIYNWNFDILITRDCARVASAIVEANLTFFRDNHWLTLEIYNLNSHRSMRVHLKKTVFEMAKIQLNFR